MVFLYCRSYAWRCCDRMKDYYSTDMKLPFLQHFEVCAVAVSHCARMISLGQLKFPPPPEPVPLCPVHTKAAICSCPSTPNDIYASFKKLTP